MTFTVGYDMKKNIDAAVKKVFLSLLALSVWLWLLMRRVWLKKYLLEQFSENFTILLFHYDGRANEWDEFEWSKKAIHVSARKQTKW